MGLFGSKKKKATDDDLPAVPPRFAPEEVHTAYKEALQKDSLPATQLPPNPQSLQQTPVQDSLNPATPLPVSPSLDSSSPSNSLDDAVNSPASSSPPLEDFPTSGPSVDPLTSPADMPVHAPEPVREELPPVPVSNESLAPTGEFPEAPSPEPDFPSAPTSLDEAIANDLPQSPASLDTASFPLADAPTQTYVPATSVADYSGKNTQDLPEDFPSVDAQSADDLSPIAPQEVQELPPSQESFDESELPEIGVPVDKYASNMASLAQEHQPSALANPVDQAPLSPTPEITAPELPPQAPEVQLPDIAPPQSPNSLPSDSMAASADVSAPLLPTNSTSVYDDFSEPQAPLPLSSEIPTTVSPIEERVILKHAVGTDVFVEKFIYEDVLLGVTGVQKDLQHAGSHLDKVLRDELAVTKKIDDWTKSLNTIQEKLMAVDIRLFEKGDVQ